MNLKFIISLALASALNFTAVIDSQAAPSQSSTAAVATKATKKATPKKTAAKSSAAPKATVADARKAMAQGNTAKALEQLTAIVSNQPKNADALLAMGECYVAMGDDNKATKVLSEAIKQGSNDARLLSAEIAYRQYRIDDATSLLKDYREALTPKRGKALPDKSGDLSVRIQRLRPMLDRVEDIVVIDSIVVDKTDFFNAYRLSPETGTLRSVDVLPRNFDGATGTGVFTTEDHREMFWAAPDADTGKIVLYETNRLNDGSWEDPQPLSSILAGDGNANFPFLMADGVTLYYACDCTESIGGYDIFLSRNDEGEYLQPRNIGLPYNSPYDDYLLAIDEMTGVGWWATDRNQLGDRITIYVFVPSDLRRNLPIDTPNLTERARLTSIADTWREGDDYSHLLKAIDDIEPLERRRHRTMHFTMPDGRIITSLDDFSNPAAEDAAMRWMSIRRQIADTKTELTSLRQAYAAGDIATESRILALERQVLDLQAQEQRLANDIVKAESATRR